MWLYNRFKNTLQSLGLKNKDAKIVFLGLDDAGKTTLLLRLKQEVIDSVSLAHPQRMEEFVIEKVRFKAWDLGGYETTRKNWINYLSDADGIIYVVDASNHKRFQQSRIQFQRILQMPEFQKVPIVVLGNKIDKVGAVDQDQLRKQLGIIEKSVGQWSENKSTRPIGVFMCSVAKKVGYGEGFKWLHNYLK